MAEETGRPPDNGVTAVMDDDTAVVELAVVGRWDRALWLQASGMLQKCLAEHPPGILIDLTHLDDSETGSATLWLSADTQGSRMQPPVRVAVCVRSGTALADRLERLGVRRRLPLYPDLLQAQIALAGNRPLTDQVRVQLPPGLGSAGTARQVVSAACRQWGMDSLAGVARTVVSELVVNAVEHAGTRIELIVTRLGPQDRRPAGQRYALRLTVYDHDPQLPEVLPLDDTLTSRGHGLRVVGAAAHVWGSMPTRRGKMVWATLRERS